MGATDKLTLSDVIAQAKKAAIETQEATARGASVADKKAIFDDNMKDAPHNVNKKEANKVIGEFLRGLARGGAEMETVTKDLGLSTGGGGYLTPLEFSSQLIELVYKLPVIRPYATRMPMSSDQLQVPLDSSTVSANWTSEFAAATQSDPVFGTLTLSVNNLIGISRMSRQILEDSAISEDLVAFVMRKFAESIGRSEDAAFMAGSGTGQPKGIRQYTFANTTAQAGASLVGDDLIDLYHTLPFQYRSRSDVAWLMHDSVVEKIRKLKDTTGRYLYEAGYGSVFVTEGMTPTLLGKPVLTQNDIPTNLGLGGDTTEVYLGSLSYYLIGDRQQIFSEVSTQEGTAFARHMAAVKVGERLDGQLSQTEPIAQLTGVK
jgi:HK97 family phage major capsid protein